MSNPLLVMAPEPKDFVITLEQFRAALDYWQPHAHLINPLSDTVDAGIEVDRPDQPAFQILHSRNADVLFSDGTPDQAIEVAVWAINTFPKTGQGEVWLVDEGYTGHTVLTPGMSADDVKTGWQEHQ